ncbi:mitochondrial 37S ribosomal protein rsm10 [Saitoella coloradoensis]
MASRSLLSSWRPIAARSSRSAPLPFRALATATTEIASTNPTEVAQTSTDPPAATKQKDHEGFSYDELPTNVQAVYHEPARHKPTHGITVCNLHLRGYYPYTMDFFADFALRAAYYLKMPASGVVPLPNKTERFTVNRAHFVHAKSKENFERVTHKRLIQIKDAHPETVEVWLAYLRQNQYAGVGMKAHIFGYDELGVGNHMQEEMEAVFAEGNVRPGWTMPASSAELAKEILETPEYAKHMDGQEVEIKAGELKTKVVEQAKEATEATEAVKETVEKPKQALSEAQQQVSETAGTIKKLVKNAAEGSKKAVQPDKVQKKAKKLAEGVKEKAAPVVEAAAPVQEKLKEVVEQVKEAVAPFAEKVEAKATPVQENVKEAAQEVKEKVQEKAAPVQEKVMDKAAPVQEKVQEVVENVQEKAKEVIENVQQKVAPAQEKVAEVAESVKEAVFDAAEVAKKAVGIEGEKKEKKDDEKKNA